MTHAFDIAPANPSCECLLMASRRARFLTADALLNDLEEAGRE